MQRPNLNVILKERFGFDSFRPNQKLICERILAQTDVLAVLPTGAGKSLCFQLPSIVAPGFGGNPFLL
eukprot:UN17207